MSKLKISTNYKGKKAKKLDFREYTKLRKNDLGSTLLKDFDIYVANGNKFVKKTIEISDALLKIIDEIVTNAEDVYVDYEGKKHRTSTIKITCDDNGRISVMNDGNGIPLYMHDENLTSVELMFSHEYSSTNYNDKVDKYSITGGLNGVGAKLTNIFSEEFTIETICHEKKQKYVQTFSGGMKHTGKPVITTYNGKPYTKITFLPQYEKLCTEHENVDNPGWLKGHIAGVKMAVERRAYEVMVYLNNLTYRSNGDYKIKYNYSPSVYYNGKKVPNLSLLEYAKMHFQSSFELVIEGEPDFPLKLVLGVIPPKAKKGGKGMITHGFEHFSYINGVVTQDLGNYMEKMLKQIEQWMITNKRVYNIYGGNKDDKTMPKSHFRENIALFSMLVYPKAQYKFHSQTKDKVVLDRSVLTKFNDLYPLSHKSMLKFYKKANIEEIITSMSGIKVETSKKVVLKMYEPATDARRRGKGCTCFLVEGNSASKLIKNIIGLNKNLSMKKYGVYSVQGVPLNALKSVTYKNGAVCKITNKLKNNQGLLGIVKVLGLDFNETYEDKSDLNKLFYQHVIFATDQDTDGIGHICPLLLTFFLTFWPNLVRKHNFLSRFRTPIIRIYKGKNVYEFYSEKEHDLWTINEPNYNPFGKSPGYDTYYYKGLACHTMPEVRVMAKNFQKNLLPYKDDKDAIEAMIAMMGDTAEIRKQVYSDPKLDDYKSDNYILLSEQFTIDSKRHGLHNIHRKIPDVRDGFIPSQRKAFAAGRSMLVSNKMRPKVNEIASYTTGQMDYQHGEKSMCDLIIRMAQEFPGAYIIPPFSSRSNGTGSQIGGRKEIGQPRYTHVGKNKIMDYLFPREDDFNYKYTFPEGSRCEPVAYAPILPRILFEQQNSLAHAWNFQSAARDFNLVVNTTKYMILNESETSPVELFGHPHLYEGMRAEVIGGKEYTFGTYEIKNNAIHITQLPLSMWADDIKNLVNNLDAKGKKKKSACPYDDVVESYTNYSNVKIGIHIVLKLKPEGMQIINNAHSGKDYIDPVEEFFNLYTVHHVRLNFNVGHKMNEFESYADVFDEWFVYRKSIYKIRIAKKLIELNAKINLLENKLAFILIDADNSIIDDKTDEEREKILGSTNFAYTTGKKMTGFMRLNHNNILKRQYCDDTELWDLIYKIDVGYNYIYDITKRMTSQGAIKSLRIKLKKCYEELRNLKCNNIDGNLWKRLWLEEINKMMELYEDGVKTGWTYDKIEYNFT